MAAYQRRDRWTPVIVLCNFVIRSQSLTDFRISLAEASLLSNRALTVSLPKTDSFLENNCHDVVEANR